MMVTFEDQLATFLNQPGVSFAAIQVAQNFPAHARAAEAGRALEQVRNSRARNRETSQALGTEASAIHERLEALAAAAQAGNGSYADLLNEKDRLKSRALAIDSKHEALVNSEEHQDAIEADPDAYMDSFYERFPALQTKRANLASYLAEQTGPKDHAPR